MMVSSAAMKIVDFRAEADSWRNGFCVFFPTEAKSSAMFDFQDYFLRNFLIILRIAYSLERVTVSTPSQTLQVQPAILEHDFFRAISFRH